ncbi:MAG: hypothetical protein ACREWG_14225 [Gammaproteobacteria bacterium]
MRTSPGREENGVTAATQPAVTQIAQGIVQLGNGLAAVAEGLGQLGKGLAIPQDLTRIVEDALAATRREEQHLGGFMGLIRLVRSKDLQRAIHLISVLPILLDRLIPGQTGKR